MKFDQKQIFVLQDTTINTVPVCILVQQFFKLEKSIEHNGSFFFVKGVWKRQWISPSSEGVHLTRSKDVTGSHLKVNGYAVSGHHAQFPQPHLSSHVGKGSDADVQLPKRANRNDSLSKFPIFTRYISGTGIHWCDAVLLPGARFGIWSKGWSCSNF